MLRDGMESLQSCQGSSFAEQYTEPEMCSQELRGKATLINTYSRREHAGSQVGRRYTVVMAGKESGDPSKGA